MKVSKIAEILQAKIMVGDNLDKDVKSACGSDLMSDVLAYVKDQAVLITGMNNIQVIRTAMMLDMVCIVFVRGKTPDEGMIQLAKDKNIILMSSNHRMYSACGLLYSNGLGVEDVTV